MTNSDPCSATNAALAAYGIPDGSRLVSRTFRELVEDGFREDADAARVAATFRATFAETAGVPSVPADVDAAIDDARHAVSASPGDDVRTGLLPAFYRAFAGYYCAYRGTPLDGADD